MRASSTRRARAVVVVFVAAIVFARPAAVVHARATPAAKCAVAKNKAAAKKILAKLACWQKALAKDLPDADPDCLTAAETKFSAAIQKAEKKGGCVVAGDEANIEGIADTCVSNVVGLTPGVACQTANLSCQCGAVHLTATQQCGAVTPQTCAMLHANAASNCTLNGQPPDGCIVAPCTDACTGLPCG